MSGTLVSRFRWWLAYHLGRLPGLCPVGTQSRIAQGGQISLRVDDVCRLDCAENGACWCGKLLATRREVPA